MGSAESSNKTMFQVAKHSTHEEDKDMLSGRNSPTPSQKSDSQGQQSKFAHFKGVVNGIRRKGGRRGLEPKTDLLSSSEHNSNESGLHFGVRVEGIDELISNTKFSRQELQRMYRGFKNECPNGTVDKDTFKKIYAQFFPYGGLCNRVVSISLRKQRRKNQVGIPVELATVVHSVHCMMGLDSLQSAGGELSVEEQVQRLFSLMDKNQDGVISEEEFLEGCEKCDVWFHGARFQSKSDHLLSDHEN
ncbi:Calsenilin [Acropora cervicornis]|uniref:Calsenilin n=1 Tax=Acropora cervicornis TaxID=6130 RepID=A0AAD9R3E7_ACRCE|nr:Calsenilin [Acropora cervicornis]